MSHVKYLSEKILTSISSGFTYNHKKNNLYYNGRLVPTGLDFWALCKKTLGENGIFEIRKGNEEAYEQVAKDGKICDEIRATLLEKKKAEYEAYAAQVKDIEDMPDTSNLYFNDSIATPLRELKIIEDPQTTKKYIYDPTNNEVYTYQVIDRTLERKIGKKYLDHYYNTNLRQCEFVYLPFPKEPKKVFKENGRWLFNTWSQPEWMDGWVVDPKITTPPEDVHELMMHLFDGDPYTFGYPILRSIIYNRLSFAVIFRGTPGCGKNIYVDDIIGGLVGNTAGRDNIIKAPRGFNSSQFHGYFARKRIAIFDECTLHDTLRNTVKDYLNSRVTLEDKHKSITDSTTVHFSVFINNNTKKKITIEFEDRKFLVVPITNTPLLNKKEKTWVDKFVTVTTKNPEVMRHLASYLINCVTPIEHPVKTKPFFELCWLSLPEYFRVFLKCCVTRKSFTFKDYKKMFHQQKPNLASAETIQDHFYIYENGNNLNTTVGEFYDCDKDKWRFESNIYGREDLLEFDCGYQNSKKYGEDVKDDSEEVV
jgi:hypothetical protein